MGSVSLPRAVLAAVLLLVVASCGGSGSGDDSEALQAPNLPEPPPGTDLFVVSTAGLDGYVRSDGFASTASPAVTGDLDGVVNGLGLRQFVSFDISSIPPGSTIVYAWVTFQQITRVGTPYDTLGAARFQHVEYGPSLDASDYDLPTLFDLGGLVAANPNNPYSGRGLPAADLVQADLDAGRTRTQFRIRFQIADSDFDGVSDHVFFGDGESLYPPSLSVDFLPPP